MKFRWILLAFPLLSLATEDQPHGSPPRELLESSGVQLEVKEIPQHQSTPLSDMAHDTEEKAHEIKEVETNKRRKRYERHLKQHKTPRGHHHGIPKADDER
jgi:hypothetical protein